ncbi:glycosyltransferase family 1 protein, partial [Streptomyces sp. SID10692]|nr:glycosyltransferase family 1 protein [Streptomyces sp. SID10692]
MSQLRTVQVLGGGSAGSSAHVGSLAAGLVARGVRVTVCAPQAVDSAHDF